jgi:hypothetical protein
MELVKLMLYYDVDMTKNKIFLNISSIHPLYIIILLFNLLLYDDIFIQ